MFLYAIAGFYTEKGAEISTSSIERLDLTNPISWETLSIEGTESIAKASFGTLELPNNPKFLIFGGWQKYKYHDDVYLLDIESSSLSKLDIRLPAPDVFTKRPYTVSPNKYLISGVNGILSIEVEGSNIFIK